MLAVIILKLSTHVSGCVLSFFFGEGGSKPTVMQFSTVILIFYWSSVPDNVLGGSSFRGGTLLPPYRRKPVWLRSRING